LVTLRLSGRVSENYQSKREGDRVAYIILIILGVIILLVLSRAAAAKGNPKSDASTLPSHNLYAGQGDNTDEDSDNWEGSFWDVEEPLPVKATLRLTYEDAKGKKSERTVDVRQFGAYGPTTLVIGRCHMRNATRTFRADRIERCVDEETGEVVSDVGAYLRAKYETSPESTKDKLLDEEYDTLRILLYVGKADGQLRAAEKEIIRNTCRAMANDSRITDQMIDRLFNALDVPSIHAFKLAVGRLVGKPLEARLMLIKASQDMVATQKTVHPSEQEALDYMEKKLAGSATT